MLSRRRSSETKRRDSEKSLAELRGLFDSLTTRGREDHGVFHDWVDEEAGGDGPQAQRNHGQVPSRPRYEEEGRAVLGGPREGRRSPRTASSGEIRSTNVCMISFHYPSAHNGSSISAAGFRLPRLCAPNGITCVSKAQIVSIIDDDASVRA